jgi:DNA processing protein
LFYKVKKSNKGEKLKMFKNSEIMLQYQIALTKIPQIGDITAKKLLFHFGDAESVFKAKSRDILAAGFSQIVVHNLKHNSALKDSESELLFIEKNKISPIFYTDNEYPYRLKFCDDGPILMYYKGNINLNYTRIISVVGTRKITEYGKWICKKMVEGFANYNVLVVSGLAYGVDTVAHQTAIDNGIPTLGITAHGHDIIYPDQNRRMAQQMLKNGGILTEFPSETQPNRENFPKRNRIIAGLADATLVVEAGSKGGALITADIANSYSRDVFAIPGRVNDPISEGCNSLIKYNKAALVTSAEDVVKAMNWDINANKNKQISLFQELTEEEMIIAKILSDKGACSIDALINLTELNATKMASILLNLEFKNIINCLPGKRYSLN